MSRDFYQVGGFRPHIQWWQAGRGYNDDKKLIDEITGRNSPLWPSEEGPIELVLGIKRSGTSHLLFSESQVKLLARTYRREYPRYSIRASDFESLSPIYFNRKEEFEETFGRLKIKSMKNREPWDNSQANKAFSTTGTTNLERAAFEHGRLLYRILGRQGSIIDLEKFGLHDLSWDRGIKIYSFAMTLRIVDTRSSEDRTSRPIALECGMAQATTPEIRYREASAVHYKNSSNGMLGAGPNKLPFDYGITEELDDIAVSARLRDFFSTQIHEGSDVGSRPILLLVYDEIVTRNLLKNAGVDTTSWKSGLKDLFDLSVIPGDNNYDRRRGRHSRSGYDGRSERSRSPARWRSSGSHSGHGGVPSSLPRRTFAPVYLVDLKSQYTALMQANTASGSITAIAGPTGLDLVDVNGWCAGNDAVTMINIWHAMVSGPSIDQQRELRNKNRDPKFRSALAAQTDDATPRGDDSDYDPTTIQLERAFEPMGSGESDYGESSNSDD